MCPVAGRLAGAHRKVVRGGQLREGGLVAAGAASVRREDDLVVVELPPVAGQVGLGADPLKDEPDDGRGGASGHQQAKKNGRPHWYQFCEEEKRKIFCRR